MALFKKLKERLFKSSAKLDEGLETLVEEGGEAIEAEPLPEVAPAAPSASPTVTEPPAPAPVPATRIQTAPAPNNPPPSPLPSPAPEPSVAPIGDALPPEPLAEPTLTERFDPPAPAVPPDPGPAALTPMPAASLDADPAMEEGAETTRPGLLGRVFGRRSTTTRILDDALLESLEDVLIQADMGVETALALSARLSEKHYGRRVGTAELKALLAREIAEILGPVARPLPIFAKRPQVVLVVGVNGSGKTTTIGKLASQLRSAGKSVVIAACDTFRAAAVEQLEVWGQRAGVPVLTAPQGSDPASLAFDAMTRAEAEGADLLLVDTAGRLQNRQDLMEELAKIVRVLRKTDAEAPHNTLLVLDATTGQNAIGQVDEFRRIADVTGLVMTKLDGTAKGGVLVALADRFGLPIHAIGVGEQIDDLAPFDPEDFAAALTGAD
ncbi:MAG: signal recognition particle-docking protein FtsY [Pseudomonadota bacterium]